MRAIDRLVEPKTIGDPLVARIAQHGLATADEDRHIGGAHVKPIEEILRLRIGIEIDVGVRMAVAREELPDAQRAAAMRRSDDDDVADAARDQLGAAKNEGAHQDGAQLGVRLDERQQLLPIELDHLAGCAHLQARDGAPAGDHRRLAGKLARLQRDDRRAAVP